jgi:hypothetical protein
MRTIMTTAHEWETAQRAWLRGSQTGRAVLLPMVRVARRVWPDVKYYLGFLTTALVLLAWSVNIVNKPLATRFGGGVTLLGLAVAIANHRLQERAGRPAIIPMHIFGRIPHAQLVVLPGGTSPRVMAAREAVIRAATEHVNGHNLVFLYVQPAAKPMTPHFMAINDPYAHDLEAQQAFSHAAQLAAQQGVPRRARQYVYRIGGLPQVAEVWRIARPEVTVALADQGLARLVQPRFVRFQTIDGMRVAFYVHQMPAAAPEASAAASSWRRWLAFPPLAPGRPRQETPGHTPGQRGAPRATPPLVPPHEPAVGAGGSTTEPPAPRPAEPNEQTGAPASPDHAPGATGPTTPERAAHDPALDAVMPPGSLEDADRYVWTGTELKRRDELAGAPPAPPEHDPSPHEDS